MTESSSIEQLHWRFIISGLWIYFLLNLLFRDLHELFRAGFLEEALTGVVNGNVVTEENLLYGGIALQIPLAMVVLTRLVKAPLNRWLNLVISILMLAGIAVFNPTPDLDDVLFMVMEASALAAIFLLALRGPERTSGKSRLGAFSNHPVPPDSV